MMVEGRYIYDRGNKQVLIETSPGGLREKEERVLQEERVRRGTWWEEL